MNIIKLLLIPLLAVSFDAGADDIEKADALFKEGKANEAVSTLQRLIQNGDAYAEYLLGIHYSFGIYLEKDFKKAEQLFTNGCKTYVEPCWRLGGLYESSGMLDSAEKYYLIAAKGDNLRSYSALYYLYSNKQWSGADEKKAKEWFEKLVAADKTNKGGCDKNRNLTRRSKTTR